MLEKSKKRNHIPFTKLTRHISLDDRILNYIFNEKEGHIQQPKIIPNHNIPDKRYVMIRYSLHTTFLNTGHR